MTILDTPQHRSDPKLVSRIRDIEFLTHIDGVDLWQDPSDGDIRLVSDTNILWLSGFARHPDYVVHRFPPTAIEYARACQQLFSPNQT